MFARLVCIVLSMLAILAAEPVLAQRAGTLQSADPVTSAPAGMRAWRITYRTTDQDGRPLTVTGMVVAPSGAAPARARKVIAWTHGSWGVVEKCGPSIASNFFEATPALAEMIGRDYVVVAPDYPGLGSPGIHGFLVGRDTAQSVLDAVRAAQRIPAAAAGGRFAIWGESQGGHAALWTATEAARYAPDLALVGTVAAAPPTDLVANLSHASDPNVRALFTAFITYSWSQRFGAPLPTLFSKFNQGVVTRLAQNRCISLDATPKLGTILGIASVKNAMKGKDLGTIQPWARIARANSVSAAAVPGPLMIAQTKDDPLVASTVTLAFARRVCAAGKRLKYLAMAGGDHAHSARDSATQSLDWIDARFAGTPAPSNCGRF